MAEVRQLCAKHVCTVWSKILKLRYLPSTMGYCCTPAQITLGRLSVGTHTLQWLKGAKQFSVIGHPFEVPVAFPGYSRPGWLGHFASRQLEVRGLEPWHRVTVWHWFRWWILHLECIIFLFTTKSRFWECELPWTVYIIGRSRGTRTHHGDSLTRYAGAGWETLMSCSTYIKSI